jgi:hypothetical protein
MMHTLSFLVIPLRKSSTFFSNLGFVVFILGVFGLAREKGVGESANWV